jgi:hypothetical protein
MLLTGILMWSSLGCDAGKGIMAATSPIHLQSSTASSDARVALFMGLLGTGNAGQEGLRKSLALPP